MKKLILILSLVLILLTSFLTNTLAIYTKTVEIEGPGNVIAKDFIFIADGTDDFQKTVKIAPEETVTFSFGVQNYDGVIVSETPMSYDVVINVSAAAGKEAIGPLVVTLKDIENNILGSLISTGVLNITDVVFPLRAEGQRHDYIIEVTWPSTENDIDFQGDNYQTQLSISATATQIVEPVTEPTTPDESSTYPGTDILLSSDPVWPDPNDTYYLYTLTGGTVFKHSDNYYYVITKTWDIDKGNSDKGPYYITSQQWDGIVRISGKILTTADLNSYGLIPAQNGDIYYDGMGNYYIYKNYYGGYGVGLPPDNTDWFKLPTR